MKREVGAKMTKKIETALKDTVELRIDELKRNYDNGSFKYDAKSSWRDLVLNEFRKFSSKSYGVYIIRQQKRGKILFIGKAGTRDEDGQFKPQDLSGRLVNVRRRDGKDIRPDDELNCFIPIIVEYIVLNDPKASDTPSSVKKGLLDLFYDYSGRLPVLNKKRPRREE